MSWTYLPGQLDYLSRIGVRDTAYIAAETGCGKTLMALGWLRLKCEQSNAVTGGTSFRGRVLIAAPQGTVRSEDGGDDDDTGTEDGKLLSQWMSEIQRFAPHVPVGTLFTWEDYQRLVKRYGRLPDGVYLTYYEAMWKNGAREYLPASWDHPRVCQEAGLPPGIPEYDLTILDTSGALYERHYTFRDLVAAGFDPKRLKPGEQHGAWIIQRARAVWPEDASDGVGECRGGIQCVVTPSLHTRILADHARRTKFAEGTLWSAVVLDEAHCLGNINSQITRAILRTQAPKRLALSATPIPNIASNLFPVMGWLGVPDWYKGDRRTVAWPYTVDEQARFDETFLCEQRDFTAEEMKREANPDWSGKCVKTSPVIASPARLVKLVSPLMAFIRKVDCNPNLIPCRTIDVRVPMGEQQSRLYDWLSNLPNIEGSHPRVRASRQLALLRAACADPVNCSTRLRSKNKPAPEVGSIFNPKVQTILELTLQCLERGEPVTIISSRLGLSDAVYFRLAQALGESKLARIDSTIPASGHATEAARFRSGEALVMQMGLRCAKAYSFSHCPNLIVGAIEYSNGTLNQAMGRIHRVDSPGSIVRRLNLDPEVRVWCVLHRASIEETMFDVVSTKEDAANIILRGQRLPRDFRPVDLGEVLVESLLARELAFAHTPQNAVGASACGEEPADWWTEGDQCIHRKESLCAAVWPRMRERLTEIASAPAWAWRLLHAVQEREEFPDLKGELRDSGVRIAGNRIRPGYFGDPPD